jgi:hypothetical protein
MNALNIKDITDIKEILFLEQIQDKLNKSNYSLFRRDNYLIIKNEIKLYIFYNTIKNSYEILFGTNIIGIFKNIDIFLLVFNLIYDKKFIFSYNIIDMREQNICYIINNYFYLTVQYNDIYIQLENGIHGGHDKIIKKINC